MTEYRLAVDRGFVTKRYPKRDLAHARLGVQHAYRDLVVTPAGKESAWIETRTVTEWTRTDDLL